MSCKVLGWGRGVLEWEDGEVWNVEVERWDGGAEVGECSDGMSCDVLGWEWRSVECWGRVWSVGWGWGVRECSVGMNNKQSKRERQREREERERRERGTKKPTAHQ